MPLRTYLALVIWISIFPLALLSAYLAFDSVLSVQAALRGRTETIARSEATALDQNLRERIRALYLLAASPHADEPSQWGELYQEAMTFRGQFGADVILADANGQMLFNTRVPLGSALPRLPTAKGVTAAARVLASGKPAAGDVVLGPVSGKPLIAIAVPGWRSGKIAFLMLATLELSVLQERLDQVVLPTGWAITLRDSTGRIMARQAPPGFDPAADVDEDARFAASMTTAPWQLEVEIPRSAYRESMNEGARYLGLFALGAILVGLLGGIFASRRLARAVGSVLDENGRGRSVFEIREVEELKQRLAEFADRRRAAEASRLASEEHFRAAFHNAGVGIALVARDGRFLDVNTKACEILGFGREELLERGFQDITHPEDLETGVRQLRALLAGEIEFSSQEKRYVRKDGSVIWARIFVSPVRRADGAIDHQVLVLEDISTLREAESALKQSEARFRAMLEQSIAGVYVIQESRVVYANPRMREMFGYGPNEPFDPDPMAHVQPGEREWVAEQMQLRLSSESAASYSIGAVRKDGISFTLGVNAKRATFEGRPAIIAIAQDITEKARAEAEVKRYIARIEQAMRSTINVVATISELRDPYTYGHERRVGEIAAAIAREMGLDDNRVDGVRIAGYMHDIGKIGVPAEILAKPTRLTKAEFDLVKEHAQKSYDILKKVEFPWPIAESAWQHHERIDGSGYPLGLKGEQILLEARILAVADTVEAMSSHRPYRPGLGIDKALAEIERGRGSVYDPQVVDACLRLFRKKSYQLPA